MAASPRKPSARLRTLALVPVLAAALAGCGSSGSPAVPTADPHAGASTGAPSPSPSAAEGATASATPAQAAVAAGIVRAASFGFDLSYVSTDSDLAALRQAPEDTLKGVVVLPSSCKQVVEDLNWSPVQLGGEAARTDFAADGVPATGSVEVAAVGDRAALDKHYGTVATLLSDCKGLNLHIQTEAGGGGVVNDTVPFVTATPETGKGAADSALLWTRGKEGGALRQQALVLLKEKDGYVAQASFIAPTGLEDPKFAQMAAGVLDAALDALPSGASAR